MSTGVTIIFFCLAQCCYILFVWTIADMVKVVIKGVTAKMQMAKLSFFHFLASEHLIFKLLVPTPIINRELWGEL